MTEGIKDRFNRVQEGIAEVATRAGRNPQAITLVVVTKFQPVEKIAEVIAAGATQLGENYPEETHQKILQSDRLSAEGLHWHMIGHLQSRKIKYLIQHFDMFHSLDRPELFTELEQKYAVLGKTLPVLIEVNVSGEETKHGFPVWDQTSWSVFAEQLDCWQSDCPHLQLKGLMTMPPLAERPEDSRSYFVKTRELAEFVRASSSLTHFTELSMGTSTDYGVAVAEGATYVRIGESIMGKRPTKN
jgi:pyridoxal phosphate enzyme (YggS family)